MASTKVLPRCVEVDFGASIFLFSKPLQLLNIARIARERRLQKPIAIFVGRAVSGMDDFLAFARRLYEGKLFREIVSVDSMLALPAVLSPLHYDTLFVDDDRVSNYKFLRDLKTRYLVVYEEGYGTYLGSCRYTMSYLRYLKWRTLSWLTGCGLDFGESRDTDFVFVQYPNVLLSLRPHMKDKVLVMGGHVAELLENRDVWFLFLEGQFHMGRATRPAIMLGTWEGARESDLEFIGTQRHDFLVYKAHPHTGAALDGADCTILHPWLPAEVLIIYILQLVQEVTVYHYSSSVELYSNRFSGHVRFHSFTNDFRFQKVISTQQRLDQKVAELDEGVL